MQGFFILLRSEITLFYHKRNEKERTDTPAKIIKEAAKRPIRKAEKNGAQKSKTPNTKQIKAIDKAGCPEKQIGRASCRERV